MHIVFVTTELATKQNASGGLASFTANMARIFAAKGHQVSIILFTTKEVELSFDSDITLINVFVKKDVWQRTDKFAKRVSFGKQELYDDIRKTLVNLEKSYYIRKRITELNKKNKVDIVHYCNLLAPSLLAAKKIPYVVRLSSFTRIYLKACEETFSMEQKNYPVALRVRLEELALKRAKHVISPSTLVAGITEDIIGVKPDILESPFILDKGKWNDSVYRQKLKDKKYVLNYGRLSYIKGTHIVAETVYQLLKEFPDYYLVMAGGSEELYDKESGEMITFDELVKRRAGEYGERVIYLGQLVREELYPVIEHAQVCWFPYRLDNLPNATIEAMAMGKVVVGSECLDQLIEDRVSGYIGKGENPDVYFRLLREALSMDADAKENMLARAKTQIERLNPDKVYKNYLQYYENVIQEW